MKPSSHLLGPAALVLASALATGAASLGTQAAAPPNVPGRDFVLQQFRFASGETLADLRVHYRTLGSPRTDGAGLVVNAVLILHGTGGAGTQFLGPTFAGELFGPGQLLDTAHYFVILPDDIGHGASSKPSDGLKARFPHYGYADMVLAEHQLVTDGLHVNHLRLIIGTSMGCMHAWMWGELYPAFMDGLVPLACAPTQIAGRNRMWRTMAMNDIRNDPAWRGGEYATEPAGLTAAWQVLLLVSSNPVQYQRSGPTRDGADSVLATRLASVVKGSDANDLLYQLDASRDYDPSGQLAQIVAPVLAINTADDAINPPELGLMDRLTPRVAHVRYVLIPLSDATRGHGTHTVATAWKSYFAEFLHTLPKR
jgi:homoserine O-acetyltransferase/O-succinyltransferase